MPAGSSIGQAILDDQTHGQGNNAMRVVRVGPSVVGGVGVEKDPALMAAVLRVEEVDVAGPPGDQITDVMQHAGKLCVSITAFATARTGALLEVAGAPHDLGGGQRFRARDALRGVRQVFPGTRHGDALLGQGFMAWNLRHLLACVTPNLPVALLQTRKTRKKTKSRTEGRTDSS